MAPGMRQCASVGVGLSSVRGLDLSVSLSLTPLLDLTPATVTYVRTIKRQFCCVPAGSRLGLGLSCPKGRESPMQFRPGVFGSSPGVAEWEASGALGHRQPTRVHLAEV